jgi:hypothetical protein
MGERGLIVAGAVHDRQRAILIEPLEPGHCRLEAERVVDLAQLVGADAEPRPGAIVGVVAERHDGVQSVVGAGELNDDENAPRRCGLGGARDSADRHGYAKRREPSGVEAEA